MTNPLGVEARHPELSWVSVPEGRGQIQSAFRVLVASSKANLADGIGDLWDSGKVASGQSTHLRYRGNRLASGMQCFWKVKVWDGSGTDPKWSRPAQWSMGLLGESDWRADWIGLDRTLGEDDPDTEYRRLSARYLRKDFEVGKPVRRATAYMCGLGASELYLNGEKVGDHVLSPGLTEYPKRSLYVVHDVSDQVVSGTNAVGVVLGNGRYFAPRINEPIPMVTYGLPKLLLQIEIEYEDGSSEWVVSDESWKITAAGPITANNEYDGEIFDARKAMPGWHRAGFDDSGWIAAEPVQKPSKILTSQMNEPIRVTETINPVALANPKPGVYVYDMGQNMVGWTKLTVEGDAGTVVKQRFAETLKDDGMLYLDNIRGARVTDTYILKGQGTEVFVPRFVFHGFRYVELTGFPGTPDLATIEGQVVHDDLESIGGFVCSDALLNRIYTNAVWGLRGNYRSIPTDCPQRDERQGWLGDRGGGARGESYLFGISNLYRKWLDDIFDAQKESGSIPDVCPAYWALYTDNVTWAGSPILLVDMLYDQYGAVRTVRKHYGGMKKWIDYMIESYLEDDLMPRDHYGDWCMPPSQPEVIHTKDPKRLTAGDYIGASYFYHMVQLMEKFAALEGNEADRDQFHELAGRMKKAFNKRFFNKKSRTYINNTATASVLALAFNLVPEEYTQDVFDHLVEKIDEEGGHISTGLIGQQNFNRVLSRYGRADLAFKVNTQKDYPGYGYMIAQGATTIWELWNGNTADPAMNSGNHVMLLGDFLIWLYEDLAGIRPDENTPGFKRIVMRPNPVAGLDFVRAWHRSPYGMIKSEWEVRNGTFDWKIEVPANSTATVHVPAARADLVTEGGRPAVDIPHVKPIGLEDGCAVFEVGSGSYHFVSEVER